MSTAGFAHLIDTCQWEDYSLSAATAIVGLSESILDSGVELPEFLGEAFVSWCKANGILIDYIEPGNPNQNAFIERFKRSYRTEVLDTWLFRDLGEVRELTWAWTLEYNEERDHNGLGGRTPAEVLQQARISTFEWST